MKRLTKLALRGLSVARIVSLKAFTYSSLGDSDTIPLVCGSHTAELKLTSTGKYQIWVDGVMKEEW